MKNVLKHLALVAFCATAAVSCQKSEVVGSGNESDIFFTLNTGDTKTYMVAEGNNYQPMWAKDDEIGVLFEGFLKDRTSPHGKLANVNEDGKTASFEGTISAENAGTLYAFYPAKIAKTYEGETVGFDIPAYQKPIATTFDPAADLLVSKPLSYNAVGGEVSIDDVFFARTLSILKINVYSTDFEAIKGQYLGKLTVTASDTLLSGRPVFDLTKGDANVVKYNTQNKSVGALYDEDIVSVGTSKTATGCSVFLMVAPVTHKNGATLKFEGETSGYKFSKEVTLPSDIVLSPGKLTEINLSLAETNCEVKVDVDYSGDYLIVSGNYLLADFNSNYYKSVAAEGSELADFWKVANVENYVWTVAKLADGSYSFCNAGSGKYLALTAESNNAHEAEELNEYTSMTITETDASLTVYSKKFPSRNLRYNTSSPRFAFYGNTTTGNAATLLKYTSDSRPEFNPVTGLSWNASGKTLSWTAVSGATNGYEYTKDNGTTIAAAESNSIDCSSWTNGNYSVKVRVAGTDAKKTSEWSSACEFTITGGAAAVSYTKVTENLGDWSGEYLLVYENEGQAYVWTGVDEAECYVTTTVSDNSISAPEGAAILTIASMEGGYSIKVNGDESKFIGQTSDANGMNINGKAKANTISIVEGSAIITSSAAVMRYNATSGQERFRYYKSTSYANQKPVQLYKLEEAAVSSIAISGTPEKKTYSVGEAFDTKGLVVTATYADASKKDVTAAVSWKVTPATLSAGTTSVSVVATYKGVSSTAFVVNGLSVEEVSALSTMDAIFAAATQAGSTATAAKVKFNNWVVSGVKDSNAYLTDNNGKGLIIYTNNHGFVAGDVLSGTVNCEVKLYNGAAELMSLTSTTEGLTVTKDGVVTPATIAIAELSGVNTGAVITFESLKYDGREFSDGTNKISPYNAFSITMPTLTSGRNYSVTGVYIQFNQTKEIAPRTENDFKPLSGPYLDASASKTSGISAAGETVTITVDTNVEGWTVSSDNAAFVVGAKSGNTVPVVVSENTSTTNERTAHITVSAEGVEDIVITLTQMKKGATMDYSTEYTSNVTLSTEGGTSASAAKVIINDTEYEAIKAGTGKVQGVCVVTIPATTKTLHFHAAAWKGESVTIEVNGTNYTLVADAGVSNNSPFTLQNDPATNDYFTFDPKGATSITFAVTSGNRFVLFGVNAD